MSVPNLTIIDQSNRQLTIISKGLSTFALHATLVRISKKFTNLCHNDLSTGKF